MRKRYSFLYLVCIVASPFSLANAQQGYEFEVYDTRLLRPGTTELELNANYVASGRKQLTNGLYPTHHMLRSSVEVATGLTDWLEGSIYFVAARQQNGVGSYVGNRARATASVPSSWNLPFEFGLTQEFGYARPGFAETRWSYELSPMIGKSWGSLAFALNPAFERSLGGQSNHPVEFEPRGRFSYDLGDEASISLEYYSSLGPTSGFDPRSEQKHQIFAAIEKELSRHWDLAVSFGRGLTAASDRAVLATRLEYRINH